MPNHVLGHVGDIKRDRNGEQADTGWLGVGESFGLLAWIDSLIFMCQTPECAPTCTEQALSLSLTEFLGGNELLLWN